jgi:hypothetical protein
VIQVFRRAAGYQPSEPAQDVEQCGVMSTRRANALTLALFTFFVFFTGLPSASAQEPSPPNERFVPADQLDAVFERDRRGVMMKRSEFKTLLEQARANGSAEKFPVPIITEHARLTVIPGDHQASVTMNLKVRQYAEGWQVLRIRAGNLLVEKAEIEGQSALIARDPEDPTALLLAHNQTGEFTVVVTMSTQLATLGGDRTAAFQLPNLPAVQLSVNCPAGRHLLVNDLKLDRPAADNAAADYVVPAGNAPDVRLRWVVEQENTEAQTLVFVRTDSLLQVQKETLRWESESRISVFGGAINRVVARVPARLEITSVESTGLEAWNLDDDPDNAGFTRVTMTWRQPFTNDRLITIRAVATTGNEAVDGALRRIPTLQFAEVTAHTGRLAVTYEDGLRLVSETGGGVRRISATEPGLSTDASVFDFWMQDFELQLAAKPRDRELFVENAAVLTIDDTTATFDASLTIETLNAPLFELLVTLPADWQLTSVQSSGERGGVSPQAEISNPKSEMATGLTWTTTSDPHQILIRPALPIAPGQLTTFILKLSRTIADPDSEQKMALPVVTAAETTTVGGSYRIRFADDLTVAPLSLTGLTPITGSGTEQVFQNLGTTVSGELSILRKPARLAVRSVLKTWADSRQQSLDAEIIADVLSGTIRTLTIRLSESLGADLRFEVRSVGPVPGIQQTRPIRPVTIIEQSAGEPVNGLRPFTLKLDQRFAGSLSLHAFIQRPRTNESAAIAAPVVQVQDAVRQHGVLVFEASPEQQLVAGPEVRSIPGLFVADAGLVEAPPATTGRRVALIYRFVQPGYAFDVTERRFATNTVPAAVCEQLANVCTLNDSGSIQRWCQARIRSSGVQTLRFALPGGEGHSFLWSTMLNGEPVEVRRDAGDYLVALPTNSTSQQHVLTVLFESGSENTGAFGQTEQGPVQFSIDAGKSPSIPIDVLQQSWRVHYPPSSLLVDSDGQFRPTSGMDQPGWLASLGSLTWPETSELPEKLIPMAIFLLLLFIVTVLMIRKRWMSLAALGLILFSVFLFQPAIQQARQASPELSARMMGGTDEVFQVQEGLSSRTFPALAESSPPSDASDGHMPASEPETAAGELAPAPAVRNDFNGDLGNGVRFGGGGFGGGGLGGGGGGFAPGVVDDESSGSPDAAGNLTPPSVDSKNNAGVPILNKVPYLSRLQEGQSSNNAPPKKGSARLSINVNLDIPADYRAREFASVADAVHQPSVLSLVVQRRGQIAAIRWLAAMVVVLLAWRLRKARMLWKLTVAIAMLLIALGASPLLSNAWQSVVDGIVIGALASVAMALVCGCIKCCECPWTWCRRRIVSRAV